MAKKQTARTVAESKSSKNISLFPFFSSQLQHPFAGAVIAAAYLLGILYLGLTYHLVGDYNVETDFFQSYVPMAKDILRGIWTIEEFRGPGYPMVLALFGSVFGNFFTAGVIASAVTASLTLFFTFEVLKKLFRSDLALVVVLLTGLNQTFVQYAYTAGTDMTFNCFTSAAVYFLLKSERVSAVNIILAALASALAYLTRYNGIVVLVAVPVMIAAFNIYDIPVKQRLQMSGLFLLGFFLSISPWGIYCWTERGSFFYNKNYLNIAYEMFAKGKMGWDQYWNVESTKYHSLGQVIFADPGLFVSTVFGNLFEHLKNDLTKLTVWGIGLCFGISAVGLWKNRPNRRQGAYFAFGALMFSVLLLVFYGERFSMFLLPIYASFGLSMLLWDRWKSVPFFNGTIISLVLIVWTFAASYDFNKVNIDSGPKEIKVIADWFNANVKDTDESKIIVCRKPHIAFYTNKTMKYFPYVNSFDALEQEVKKLNASYFFYGIFEANMRPEFQSLLDPSKAPAWLEPITYTVNPPSVLYRVKK
ncbi:MAG: ArnT family glycosyltransferase [Bacteroidota bacterium]